jgi:hypothetical protein
MTIARTKVWATDEVVTSAQLNAVDSSAGNAVDKRSGQTETVQSTLTLSSPGTITIASSGQIKANTASAIQVNSPSGIIGNSAGAINPGVSQGISSGVSGGIYGSVSGAIMGAAAGAITSLSASGGITLAGGATDWPTFSTPRTKTRVSRMSNHIMAPRTGFDFSFGDYVQSSAANSSSYCFFNFIPHHGATLGSIKMYFTTPAGWTVAPLSAGDWPGIQLYRTTIATNTTVSMNSGFTVSSYAAESVATMNNLAVKSVTFTCNQNNVIDTSVYTYGGNIFAYQSGSSSQPNMNAYSFEENYTSISNMQFA